MKLQLEKDTEPESMDNKGQTPLSWAAIRGDEAIVEATAREGR